MLFNTLKFLLLFPFVFLLYWAIPSRYNQWKKWFLILTSYLLYMNWIPAYAMILIGITFLTYWGGRVLQLREESKDFKDYEKNRKKWLAWLFAMIGFLPLFTFKYFNFINSNISEGLASIGLKFTLSGLNWAIPVGISFFSFQAVGYMLDVYHGRIKVERNLTDYVLFVSFFPQVASGPISKADELLPQIKKAKIFNYNQAVSGLKYLLWGMFLKVAIADRAGIYVDTVFGSYDKFTGAGCALASVIYSIQIYSDFAGYSLMAVGIAKTLGFNLINNFNRPYLATSVSEFWKRWHISLTRWLTYQVYVPMGGSRCSKIRNYWNILVTFIVSGIWHGANWTFIVWGGIHGAIQIIEKTLGWNKKESKGYVKAIRIVITFAIVTVAWTIFRSPSIEEAFGVIGHYSATEGQLIADIQTLLYLFIVIIPLLLYELGNEFFPKLYCKFLSFRIVRWTVYLTLIALIVLIGVHDGSSFIYVSF